MKKFYPELIIITVILIVFISFSYVNGETETNKEAESISAPVSNCVPRNEQNTLKQMKKILSNNNLELYLKQDEDLLALVNKKNNFIWWSAPINADCDSVATNSIKSGLKSSLVISYHKKKDSISENLKSAVNASISYNFDKDCLTAVYDFKSKGIKIPVKYSLGENFLEVIVSADKICETDDNLINDLSLISSFGAGSQEENGYFIIPDGCGAVINFNNGKTTSAEYSSMVYGNNISCVPEKISTVNSQINLPVYAIVKGNNALTAIAHRGDENVSVNASVSEQSKSQYNKCFFRFIMRESDSYYIGNEKNPVTVFDNSDISEKNISVRYYVLEKENLSPCDVADCYRNYLSSEYGFEKKDFSSASDVYIDIYGGTVKKKSFAGIPLYQPLSITSFRQAADILNSVGTENITVSYKKWSENSIRGKIEDSFSPADILGGKTEFQNLYENSEISLFPEFENIIFASGNGYYSFADSVIRISGAFSRISEYDYAYGLKDKFRRNLFLISPDRLPEIYQNIFSSCKSAGINKISLGKSLSVLYGNYGKNEISRGDMKNYITDSLKNADDISILAEYPNAYALPYIDYITDVPLSSGQYDIFDYDIPFYQMIIHGFIPYSSEPVNSSPNPQHQLLKSVVYGSALKYDLIAENSDTIKDTDADIYFSGGYDMTAQDYKKTADFIHKTKNSTICGFKILDNGFQTDFSNGFSLVLKNDEINIISAK